MGYIGLLAQVNWEGWRTGSLLGAAIGAGVGLGIAVVVLLVRRRSTET